MTALQSCNGLDDDTVFGAWDYGDGAFWVSFFLVMIPGNGETE
jgi:hypothetical protein